MLLERLREYSEQCAAGPPPRYLRTPLRWLIDLDGGGNCRAWVDRGTDGKDTRGLPCLAPHIGRSLGVQPKLLADNAEYVLGLARDPSKQARVDRCHESFRALVRDCAEQTGEPTVCAVLTFLEALDLTRLALPAGFDPAHALTFRVNGTLPIAVPAVRAYWANAAGAGKEAQGRQVPCLVCAQQRPVVSRLPLKIKRVPAGQTSGMALISTNASAFVSYGLEDMSGAPICQECGEKFANAANALIDGEETHITLGPVVYLLWTHPESPFPPASWLRKPPAEQIKLLQESAGANDLTPLEHGGERCYATAFAASGARVVVRDWIATTVPEAQRHLARYFTLQELVQPDGSASAPLGLYALCAATVRDANREISANVPRALLRMALVGTRLPRWLLYQALKQNRAEQRVTRPRAALIKMVLAQDLPLAEGARMAQLEPGPCDAAYLCGRLLAVLERLQARAGVRRTLTDRCFATASTAPALVFGRLLRRAPAQLARLRTKKPGGAAALQKQLEEIQKELSAFPHLLTLEKQGRFSLGYYHQRARDRAEGRQRQQQRAAGKATTAHR